VGALCFSEAAVIVRRKSVRSGGSATCQWLHYSDDGGLSQYGVYVETLQPGAESSERHWHEKEDEFLYVLEGEATVIEDGGEALLLPGDAACWPAGVANAHCVANRSAKPCTYVVVGTRVTHDVCHYPDAGEILRTEGESWRREKNDGTVLRSGRCKSPPGRG
jgi:uncharacterized cupin superfamily protein